jgi:hypothetical protein
MWNAHLDVVENEKDFLLSLDIPGVAAEAVKIEAYDECSPSPASDNQNTRRRPINTSISSAALAPFNDICVSQGELTRITSLPHRIMGFCVSHCQSCRNERCLSLSAFL